MHRSPPFELLNCVENLDFWVATELHAVSDRRQTIAVFDEMAERARALGQPEHAPWLELRLAQIRRRIDRRTELRPLRAGAVAARAKAGQPRLHP